MAAFSHHQSGPGSRPRLSSSSIGGAGDVEAQLLPVGSCNFRDLSIGVRAPTCGCTRFWLNANNHNLNTYEGNSFCFCGHHACFHDTFNQRRHAVPKPTAMAGLTSATGRTVNLDNNSLRQTQSRPTSEPQPTGLGICSEAVQQQPSINVRVWEALNAFARDQEDGPENTSHLPSTAAPSVAGEMGFSLAQVLQESTRQHRLMGPPVNIPHGYINVAASTEEYSATEMATPSIAGTPDFRALAMPTSEVRGSPSNIPPADFLAAGTRTVKMRQSIEVPHQPLRALTAPVPPTSLRANLTPHDIQDLLLSYGHRIDTLESLSFSQVPVEEVQEKMELFDGRLLDLEQWRGDHEHQNKQHSHESPPPPEASSSKRRRLLPAENCSFGSDVSFDLNAAAHTEAAVMATLVANAETLPRIEALESRMADLEDSSLPTFTRPWQVQVVLLPWGRDLRGIWFSSDDSTQHSMRNSLHASEEWTGASSLPRLSYKSSTSAAWTTESIQAWADEATDWLSPKACGPTGTVFARLASRGLVRDISLSSGDSRHILQSIAASFADVLRNINDDKHPVDNQYQGLSESFLPLRKVRKSSRLRFLSPAEMVTSSTWTAQFLDSSVFMKVNDGERRLYITTPEGYKQHTGLAWSWPKIRQLPLYDATGEEQAAQATSVAIEVCWSYNDRLDRSLSTHTSFAESQWSTRSQRDQGENPQDIVLSSLPRAAHAHQRTVSLPSSISVGDQAIVGLPKRRVASFETPYYTQPTEDVSIAKRRRVSHSPEAERRGVGFTPRYSREPPSPFTTSDVVGEVRSQAASSRKRGMTPAYATPHSNNNFVSRIGGSLDGADGDTEPDTDMLGVQKSSGDKVEDEWNGVDEDMQAKDDADDDDGYDDDDDDGVTSEDEAGMDDGDDLEDDEGLTVYES